MNEIWGRGLKPADAGGGNYRRARASFANGILVAALAAALVFAASCREPSKPQNSGQPPAVARPDATQPGPAQPAAPGPPPALALRPLRDHAASLILIYTTGVSGELTDCGCPHHPRGGMARRAHYALGLEQARQDVVQVDGGDAFFRFMGPSPHPGEDMKKQARAIAAAMAHMKVDAMNVGKADLAAGYAFLKNELEKGQGHEPLHLVSANLVRSGTREPAFSPYVLVEAGGAKVGIFGLFAEGQTGDTALIALDPVETAKKMIAELRPRCDVVIGLYAAAFAEAGRIAQSAPGADIVVVGEPRATMRTTPMVIGDTILAQAGNRGMFLGRMDLTLNATGNSSMSGEDQAKIKAELARLDAQKTLLEGEIRKDPSIRGLFTETMRKINELNRKLVSAGAKLDYKNSLVSMDLALPEDPVVAKLVLDAGVKPRTPAPAPAPAPAGVEPPAP
ncbi:MAG TPA: hypothetical protein VM658_10685 [bacterium]|nr:hypothetical protein [bacterium]